MIKELFAKDVQSRYGDFYIKDARDTGGLVMVKADSKFHLKIKIIYL